MIEVGVREDHRIDGVCGNRQRLPIPFTQLLQTLKQTAVDEHAVASCVEEMLGAGDGACGAKECQRWHRQRLYLRQFGFFSVNPVCAIVWLAFGVIPPI
jgi:hypothetical protein